MWAKQSVALGIKNRGKRAATADSKAKRPEGLRVNAICPGTIETPPVHAPREAGHDFTDQAQKAPLRRLGTTAEAGELVALAIV